MDSIQSSQAAASTEGTDIRKTVVSKWNKVRFWGTLLIVVFLGLYQWRSSSESSDEKKVDMDFPEVKLTEIGKRNGAVIPMNFTTEAKVRILVPLTKVGVAHELCREVVEPIRVLDLVDTPKNQVESDNPNKVGSTHFMHLSREMKGYLFKHGVKEVRVNFYLIEKWAEDPSRCS